MYQEKVKQYLETEKVENPFTVYLKETEDQCTSELDELLQILSSNPSWYDRKVAAQKIGSMRNSEALPGLLPVLTSDPFWKVRCAVIQALTAIGDTRAIQTLQKVERDDGFEVVRSYAAEAIELLSFV
jgi:HEAT repeat protein